MIDLSVCDLDIVGFEEIKEDIIFAEMARRERPQKEALAMITPLLNKWINMPETIPLMIEILLYEQWRAIQQDRESHCLEDVLEWMEERDQKPN